MDSVKDYLLILGVVIMSILAFISCMALIVFSAVVSTSIIWIPALVIIYFIDHG